MQIHYKFPSNFSHSLLPYRLCKDIQVGSHQLRVEPSTKRHVTVKPSLISHRAPHKNAGPVVIVRTQQFQSRHPRQQFHARRRRQCESVITSINILVGSDVIYVESKLPLWSLHSCKIL